MAVLRWIGFLPAALGGYIGAVIVGVILTSLAELWPGGLAAWMTRVVTSSLIGGYGFTWAGTKTAPSHKTIVAIVLVGIVLIGVGGMGALSLVFETSQSPSEVLISILATAGGAFFFLRQQLEEQPLTSSREEQW